MKRQSNLMMFVLLGAFVLSACSSGGGGSLAPEPVALGSVAALYPANGANWNDYVKNDGPNRQSATGAACEGTETGGYDACIHGGETRVVEVTGKTSCTGLTAADDLDAFSWTCDASTNPVRMVSTGLKDGKYLSDLIDFDAASWKANRVTVSASGAAYGSTPSSVWWTNSMVVDNDGMTSGEMDVAGTIYLVTANATGTYTMGSDKIALVIKPGVTVTGPGAGGSVVSHDAFAYKHLWIEGAINAANAERSISWGGAVFSVIRNVAVSNSSLYGVHLIFSYNNLLTNLTASNGGWGVYLSNSSNNALSNVTAANSSYYGVYLEASSNNNMLSNVTASNNNYGVYLFSSSNNTLSNVTASNNGSDGVSLDSSSNNMLSRVTTTNNSGDGISLSSSENNTLVNVTSASNGIIGGSGYGVSISLFSTNNTLLNVTASNNGIAGIELSGSSHSNTLANVTAANNGEVGVSVGDSSDNAISNMTAANNGDYGVELWDSSNNYFTGLLKVGNNGLSDCFVSGTAALFHPGLDDDADPSDQGNDAVHSGLCTQEGISNFGTAVTGVTFASSFVGKATSDSSNANGASGTMLYDGITDWTTFDNAYRGWGLDGGAFPNGSNIGHCTMSTLCRIWDWSLVSADTVIRNILSLPTGSDTLTHTWSDNSTIVILRNAVEIMGDGLGNDNGLCESHETCLYTPNIGSYQGHGNLISAGAFTDGAIAGVTLMKYQTNGY